MADKGFHCQPFVFIRYAYHRKTLSVDFLINHEVRN